MKLIFGAAKQESDTQKKVHLLTSTRHKCNGFIFFLSRNIKGVVRSEGYFVLLGFKSHLQNSAIKSGKYKRAGISHVLIEEHNVIRSHIKIDLYSKPDVKRNQKTTNPNIYSSPETPHHSWVGASGLFWLGSGRGSTSVPSCCCCCCPPLCSQSSSLKDTSPELLLLLPLSPPSCWGGEWTQESAGDVSLLSDRSTPLPELYSLFESTPRAIKTRGREVWTDGERTSINKRDVRRARPLRNSHAALKLNPARRLVRCTVTLVQSDGQIFLLAVVRFALMLFEMDTWAPRCS